MPVLHHIALSVRSATASIQFYKRLGFTEAVVWHAPDGTLSIHQLIDSSGVILELFAYAHNTHQPQAQPAIGNDLETVGVKHIGFSVDNLDEFHATALSWSEPTDIVMGRTGLRYCFIKDPDGNWVEIVEDKRNLVPGMAVVDMSSS